MVCYGLQWFVCVVTFCACSVLAYRRLCVFACDVLCGVVWCLFCMLWFVCLTVCFSMCVRVFSVVCCVRLYGLGAFVF